MLVGRRLKLPRGTSAMQEGAVMQLQKGQLNGGVELALLLVEVAMCGRILHINLNMQKLP